MIRELFTLKLPALLADLAVAVGLGAAFGAVGVVRGAGAVGAVVGAALLASAAALAGIGLVSLGHGVSAGAPENGAIGSFGRGKAGPPARGRA